MTGRRLLVYGLALAAALPLPLAAQNSAYGVLGIGFPARQAAVAARAVGGGSVAFDPESPLNPAAPARLTRVTVAASWATEFRSYTAGGVSAAGLRATTFPLLLIGGSLGRSRFGYSVGYAGYAERTFDVTASDQVLVGGQPVDVVDRVSSKGGITDVRAALSWSPLSTVSVGVAGHILGGRTKSRVLRQFSDASLRPFADSVDEGFSGLGMSVGILTAPVSTLWLAAAVRIDTRLERSQSSTVTEDVDLPVSLTGGLQYTPHPAFRFSGTATWRTWSDAAPDLAPLGRGVAFDTWEVGVGVEIGGPQSGLSKFPLRLGVRWAQLPFSANAEQPREIDLAMGSAMSMAGGRANLDFSLERVLRDGGNAKERVWQVALGLQLRP